MELSDFDFELPEQAIARYPATERDASRLMVLDRRTGRIEHHVFRDLLGFLEPGDLLVFNDTRVLPARLSAKKETTGGHVDILLVEPIHEPSDGGAHVWRAMVGSSKALRPGAVLRVEGAAETLSVDAVEPEGFALLRCASSIRVLAASAGVLPLPPYLRRAAEPSDADRYQTVFSDRGKESSVAAPTAGLHFTDALLEALGTRGVERATITLDVGPGTFLPVRVDRIEDHRMHSERFIVDERTVEKIRATRARRGRVIAVGTTVARVLETVQPLRATSGSTEIFLRPGHAFRGFDALITNFHLPKSTLLMLVSAFASRDLVLTAYREALSKGYRFFSYGDAMLIT